MIQLWDIVLVDQVAEHGVELVQRVVLHQVNISVADGDIALGIHCAVVAKQDLISRILCAQINGADRIIQTILAVILYRLNDEGCAESRKWLQQFLHFFFIDRESFIRII